MSIHRQLKAFSSMNSMLKQSGLTTKSRLLLALLLCASLSPSRSDSGGILTVTLENDVFAGTDRHYTHGTRLSYLHPEATGSSWMDPLLDRFKAGLKIEGKRFGLALGQNMYTPANLAARILLKNDRPYAGWLYGGLILQRRGTEYGGHVAVLDHLELNVGVVGPESFAEDTQIWWHEVIDSGRPVGWDHQLRSEPGVVLIANRNYTLATPDAYRGWGSDLTASIGGTLGNISAYLNGGVTFRTGYRLPRQASGGPIQPTVQPSAFQGTRDATTTDKSPRWGVALFGGIDGRAVGRNIFLDGNTFRHSHSVDKEPVVADLKTGLNLQIRCLDFTAAYVYRTREFRTQPELNQFGSLSVGIRF